MSDPVRDRAGAPRTPSMADVAAHVGVSHQTVSRVLNGSPAVREQTRARVLAAIDELGYRRNSAARVLATNRSGRIGMVAAHLTLHGPGMVLSAVNRAGRAAGYDVSLVGLEDVSPSSLREAIERLLDQAVEAIVIAVAHRDARKVVRGLDLPIPVVVVEGVRRGDTMASGIDQELGAALAVRHLLELGHRQVAHVAGPLDWIEAQQRRQGWRRAHRDADRAVGPEVAGDWTAESGYRAGLLLAEADDVTAVFAANDHMALGVLRALHERGRAVPGQVSVVGFDNLPDAAHYWPALTTVEQDFAQVGLAAVGLVVRALAGERRPATDLVLPRLVVRSSTDRPPVGEDRHTRAGPG